MNFEMMNNKVNDALQRVAMMSTGVQCRAIEAVHIYLPTLAVLGHPRGSQLSRG